MSTFLPSFALSRGIPIGGSQAAPLPAKCLAEAAAWMVGDEAFMAWEAQEDEDEGDNALWPSRSQRRIWRVKAACSALQGGDVSTLALCVIELQDTAAAIGLCPLPPTLRRGEGMHVPHRFRKAVRSSIGPYAEAVKEANRTKLATLRAARAARAAQAAAAKKAKDKGGKGAAAAVGRAAAQKARQQLKASAGGDDDEEEEDAEGAAAAAGSSGRVKRGSAKGVAEEEDLVVEDTTTEDEEEGEGGGKRRKDAGRSFASPSSTAGSGISLAPIPRKAQAGRSAAPGSSLDAQLASASASVSGNKRSRGAASASGGAGAGGEDDDEVEWLDEEEDEEEDEDEVTARSSSRRASASASGRSGGGKRGKEPSSKRARRSRDDEEEEEEADEQGAGEGDDHNDQCAACGKEGNLICCDTCPLVYHVRCAGLRRAPDGEWKCPECANEKCGKCGKGPIEVGQDIMCGDGKRGCDRSFHLKCVGLSELPEGDWYCPKCAAKIKMRIRT